MNRLRLAGSSVPPGRTASGWRGGFSLAEILAVIGVIAILLGVFGLSAWLTWLDYVLLPALVLFAGLTAFALIRMKRQHT